jgi:hypothetical protein
VAFDTTSNSTLAVTFFPFCITFDSDLTTKMYKALPKGIKVDPDPPTGAHLRWEFQEVDECSLHRAILNRSLELLSWAEQLKPRW